VSGEEQRPADDRSALPSVDRVLRHPLAQQGIAMLGRHPVLAAVRDEIADIRNAATPSPERLSAAAVAEAAVARAACAAEPSQRPVFNLTGTVLHTNLGRALLAAEAIEAAARAMREPTNLEYQLDSGVRGDRDEHVAGLLRDLTGAEDAMVVNNNAAAVMLTLHALARRREAIVSRGELVEIGGAFRMPDIVAAAGVRLREIGTTNRTHLADYRDAISPRTGLLLKVHTSNYVVQGFTSSVSHREVAALAHEGGLPFVDDLGSGVLVELSALGLASERTVQQALQDGADIVTFSGDKLLGGPQAGLILGRRALLARLRKSPLKRALRIDKARLAALEATLRLYHDPDRLQHRLPTLRLLGRPLGAIRNVAHAVQPHLARAVGDTWQVRVADTRSEVGSGALPLATLDSAALVIGGRGSGATGRAVEALARAFRRLPRPVVGRIAEQSLWFDCRCLEDETSFVAQLDRLESPGRR
jgi:L-seryl-tRNA(Ser) seleniumtransferase